MDASPAAATQSDAGACRWRLEPERAQDAASVAALVDRAFGPGRYAKAAERLRESNRARLDLSVCAWAGDGDELLGAVTLWPIRIGGTAALFLGPIAVEAAWRSRGIAGAMVEQACQAAGSAGEKRVLLVGDMPLFGPLGFEVAPPGRLRMPGPVNPQRLLWRALAPGALDGIGGEVGIAPSA